MTRSLNVFCPKKLEKYSEQTSTHKETNTLVNVQNCTSSVRTARANIINTDRMLKQATVLFAIELAMNGTYINARRTRACASASVYQADCGHVTEELFNSNSRSLRGLSPHHLPQISCPKRASGVSARVLLLNSGLVEKESGSGYETTPPR